MQPVGNSCKKLNAQLSSVASLQHISLLEAEDQKLSPGRQKNQAGGSVLSNQRSLESQQQKHKFKRNEERKETTATQSMRIEPITFDIDLKHNFKNYNQRFNYSNIIKKIRMINLSTPKMPAGSKSDVTASPINISPFARNLPHKDQVGKGGTKK